ncbi:MAG: hypothetical protein JSS81_22370 [Acidobacteria bacterium]|nr:hypothetical protein [Acidobacteriota bacterium]
MKIYFAYRSGYIPNNRHLKVFEAASVLDWFRENWDALAGENLNTVRDFLGVRPYGLPFYDYQTQKPVAPPESLKGLKSKIRSFAYTNEVKVAKDCVKVFTDDDEIELAWFVFDEDYAAKNMDRIAVWLRDSLPLDFGDEPAAEKLKSRSIRPKGGGAGTTYILSSVIYDSSNLDDLEGPSRIEGVAVPGLLDYFRENDPVTGQNMGFYALDEIRFIQQLCRIFPDFDQRRIFETLAKYPFSEIFDFIKRKEITEMTREDLEKYEIRETAAAKASVVSSPHLVEITVPTCGVFFNYTVIFDDYWLAENPTVGKSLAAFCSRWSI